MSDNITQSRGAVEHHGEHEAAELPDSLPSELWRCGRQVFPNFWLLLPSRELELGPGVI